MKESGGHSKHKIFGRFLTAFIFVLFLIVVLGVVREYVKRRELDREVASLEAEVKNLGTKKKDFLQAIELYQSDFFIEKEAREKFNLKKSGETVSVIPIGATTVVGAGAVAGLPVAMARPSRSENARDWWEYFFGG